MSSRRRFRLAPRAAAILAAVLAAATARLPAAPVQAAIEADLAIGYAPSYADSVGGDENVEVLLANTIAGNNRINEISGTGAALRIVGFVKSANDPVNWTTTGGMVGWLSNNDSRVADVVAFGAANGADLVTYIVQNSDSGSIAAVAQQPGMYSAHNPGAIFAPIVAHEIGHNYGRSHSDGVLSPKSVMLHNYCGGGSASPHYFTNPGIVFNGTRMVGTGDNCGQGGLVNGGDNSAPSAQSVANRRERLVSGPRLDHVVRRWLFTAPAGSAPAGTTVADEIGAAPAVVRGNGATFTGAGLRLPGGTTGDTAANSIAAYIDLPNGLLSSRTSVTIELWATPLSAPNWGRLLEFGRPAQAGDGLGAPGEYTGAPGTGAPGATQSSDGIMLSASIGTNLSAQRFEAKLDGAATTINSALPTFVGVPHHYAITFTFGAGEHAATGGRWQWYRDGHSVAFLDVAHPLSSIEDVNNWLGRSLWSGDSLANVEYTELRLSDVALSPAEIVANFRLGPAYSAPAQTILTASDASGESSFASAGAWSDASAPSAARTYETFSQTLRTPASGSSHTFAGAGLRLSGGRLLHKGPASGVVTIHNLVLNGGTVANGNPVYTLAGSVSATSEGGVFNNIDGPTLLAASLSGSGPFTHLGQPTTLVGSNAAFTGRTFVGNGSPGALVIDSPARLGAVPASFVADQLVLNRGTLTTTATMALDAPARGIRLDVSGGVFNVASGTTLTITSPVSTPAPEGGAYVGSLTKSGAGALVLAAANPAFQGQVYADTSSTNSSSGLLRVAHPQALINARSPIFIRNNNSGSSTLQLDGAAGNITQSQRLQLSGRTSATVAVQNLSGVNSVGGVTTDFGGSFYVLQSDAGTLRLTGNLTSVASGTRIYTLQGAGDFDLAGGTADGTATVALAKTGAGTFTLSSSAAHTGATTVSGGALRLTAAGSLASGGSLSVASAATLAGIGSVAAPATVAGLHQPGLPAGAQTFTGTLAYAATSRLRWTLQADTESLVSTGRVIASAVTVAPGATLDLKLDEAGSTTDYLDVFWTQPRTWSALAATGQSGSFALGAVGPDALGRAASEAGAFTLAQSAAGVTVQWTPHAYATWRGETFGAQAGAPAVTAFDADPDGDGLKNGLEYFLGVDPVAPGATPATTELAEERLSLAFTRRVAATDVTATVQGADSPGGPWTDLARSTAGAAFVVLAEGASVAETGTGDFRSVEVRDAVPADAAHPRRFLRLVVTETAP